MCFMQYQHTCMPKEGNMPNLLFRLTISLNANYLLQIDVIQKTWESVHLYLFFYFLFFGGTGLDSLDYWVAKSKRPVLSWAATSYTSLKLYNPQLVQMLNGLNRKIGRDVFISANTQKMHNDFVSDPRAFGTFLASKISTLLNFVCESFLFTRTRRTWEKKKKH